MFERGKNLFLLTMAAKYLTKKEKLSLLLPNLENYIIWTLRKNKCLLMQLQHVQIMILDKRFSSEDMVILEQRICKNERKHGKWLGFWWQRKFEFLWTICRWKTPSLFISKVCWEKSNELLWVVHRDVCGKIKEKSLGGCEYFVKFIDD